MKHYKSVEFLSIFRMSRPPTQTQSPPIENFLATVLFAYLLNGHEIVTKRGGSKVRKIWSIQCRSQPKTFSGEKNHWLEVSNRILFGTPLLKSQNDYICQKFGGWAPLTPMQALEE